MGFSVPDCLATGGSSGKCDAGDAKAIIANPPTLYASKDMGRPVKEIDMNDLICDQSKCRAVAARC